MVNYKNAVIYKIYNNENNSLCYIGSTCNFRARKSEHKSICYNKKRKQYNSKIYQMIRDNGGWEAFTCVIIEEYPCESKVQLCMRENEYMIEYKVNMNVLRAYTSREEKKQYSKQYDIDNVDKIRERTKKHRSQKVTCECGCILTQHALTRHKRSQSHLNLMS